VSKKMIVSACSLVIVLLSVVLGLVIETHAKSDPADRVVLWREPDDIQRRNLLLGPGGEEMKPDLRRVTLIKEEKGGHSKKYRVVDASGREWVAKVGKEAQSETAATRLLWASGYFVDTDYLVPSVHIEGLNKTLRNVRFGARPKDEKRTGEWKWKSNPFVGRREFQGLKVMMALLNNWDTKDSNNRIVVVKNEDGQKEERYVVHDLGASFGKKMNWFERNLLFKRDRNNTEGYARAHLISHVHGGSVELNYWSKNRKTLRTVSVEDARWMGEVLSRLSQKQIADAFRAANYTPDQVRVMTQAVRARIRELNDLPRGSQLAQH
jgi:hypothetical protein